MAATMAGCGKYSDSSIYLTKIYSNIIKTPIWATSEAEAWLKIVQWQYYFNPTHTIIINFQLINLNMVVI